MCLDCTYPIVKLTLLKCGLQLNQLFYLFQGMYKMSDIFSTSARCKTQQPTWEVRFFLCKIVSVTSPRYLEAERLSCFIVEYGNYLREISAYFFHFGEK